MTVLILHCLGRYGFGREESVALVPSSCFSPPPPFTDAVTTANAQLESDPNPITLTTACLPEDVVGHRRAVPAVEVGAPRPLDVFVGEGANLPPPATESGLGAPRLLVPLEDSEADGALAVGRATVLDAAAGKVGLACWRRRVRAGGRGVGRELTETLASEQTDSACDGGAGKRDEKRERKAAHEMATAALKPQSRPKSD